MDHTLKYQVHTFGCKVNTYDAGLIQKNLNAHGFAPVVSGQKEARIHVLNTCAVTAEATKEAVRYIRRLKVKDPFCTVVVTGCAAQVDTGSFSGLPGADLIVANSHKGSLPDLLSKHFRGELTEKVFKSNIFKKEDLEAGGGIEKSHTRAFLKIQDGCNSFCTYCIIPYARGKSRSIPVMDLVQRINDLYAEGAREVVLTGVHIGDYEDTVGEKKYVMEDLIENLLARTKVPRFRLASLEPVEVSERLLELYQDPRLCPHFHMSIQSANTDVLFHMKRKYTQEDVRKSLNAIAQRVPNSFVGMDVIVGFPTETEEQFQDTYDTLASLPWTKLHVFPYSERQGTRAAAMEASVYPHVRAERAARLRELSISRYTQEAQKQLGSVKKTLILKNAAKGGQGLSHDYWPVEIEGAESFIDHWSGQEIDVRITGYDHSNKQHMEGHLRGEVIL
ncbi:tRNA (N(6)-L-threonylcarbamoyladenosine(37)-C(2))-methylthiotransferase MtaB [Bdellovibrio bacteriovorus]|uniref:tRNA (N(6)-L-threonylcarbamoyladenosine(37)-C(2))-methylthiotransferase MtaB n=1 Tax=Bdellovibrio bacteriovorus TaxID=959 RepID=A0A150WJQ5_BDEBC|nr:tRNA (N(6)-L-threonylcarbamoyladenosine(37)-C(2))-methylthiotransferase MtaB [Bdellovibrio bacteriovorus]KYG63998.1 tRNA (N(6)-L-threonylcarbamoyladenosine(37)-C(2))-methylthiotransferase MtaB [Bdellovibrio bacteriovorus]